MNRVSCISCEAYRLWGLHCAVAGQGATSPAPEARAWPLLPAPPSLLHQCSCMPVANRQRSHKAGRLSTQKEGSNRPCGAA